MLKLFNELKNLLNGKDVVFLCHDGEHLIKKGMVGRKKKYDESFPARVLKLAKKGLSHREIYEQLGISKITFYYYWKEYPEFADALKRNG